MAEDKKEDAGGRPWWAIPLLLLGITAGLALGIGVTGFKYAQLWMEGKVSEVALDLPEEHARGARWGVGKPAAACVDAGVEEALPCGKMDMFCQMSASLFTHGCLGAADGAGELCAGVPSIHAEDEVKAWAIAECAGRGHAETPTCAPLLMQSLGRYCTEGAIDPGPVSPTPSDKTDLESP